MANDKHLEILKSGVRAWNDWRKLDNLGQPLRKDLLTWTISARPDDDEIDKALEKERMLQNERGSKVSSIIPLNLDNFVLAGWQDGRASTLRKRVVANFVGWETDNSIFESGFENVVRALHTGDNIRPLPPNPKL